MLDIPFQEPTWSENNCVDLSLIERLCEVLWINFSGNLDQVQDELDKLGGN